MLGFVVTVVAIMFVVTFMYLYILVKDCINRG